MIEKSKPLTLGNLNNHHFYLGEAINLFPHEVVGGKNVSEAGLSVIFKYEKNDRTICIKSDIDGSKKIIRKRSWVADFFESHKKNIGDQVTITKISSTEYRLS